jgi:uncharacterized damage-inducible protein DinB
MDIKQYIKQTLDYSYWANHRYFAVTEGLTDEQLRRKQRHSWGDVHSVLVHMMSSETVWLKRWQGEAPKQHLEATSFPNLSSLKSAWAEVETNMRAFVEAQSEEDLQNVITYTNFTGQTFRVPLWQMLMHVTNHATHHRGELAAMFALMDVPHPEEEVIQYFLDLSGQKRF